MTAEIPEKKFYVVTVYTPNAKDDLSRLPLRSKHWDPALPSPIASNWKKTKPVIFLRRTSMWRIPSSDLANPQAETAAKKAFTDEETARDSRIFVGRGFSSTPSGCSPRVVTGTTRWWSHFRQFAGAEHRGGESTTFSCRGHLRERG